jgi:hypothetical protein
VELTPEGLRWIGASHTLLRSTRTYRADRAKANLMLISLSLAELSFGSTDTTVHEKGSTQLSLTLSSPGHGQMGTGQTFH